MPKKRVAFFYKLNKPCSSDAATLAEELFKQVDFFPGNTNDPFPSCVGDRYDIIISYLSPWILPQTLLCRADIAINFHPGPPSYPGIGCYNFALYNNVKEYGVTCHHMLAKVDSGKIVATSMFPISVDETVLSLSLKCYAKMFSLFVDISSMLHEGLELPESASQWQRAPYTRQQLNELCRIAVDMDQDEIKRRVRATNYPGAPGAFLKLAGYKFAYSSK